MHQCYYCAKSFAHSQSLRQHLRAKHESSVVLLDAMLSLDESYSISFQNADYTVLTLPDYMREKSDAEVINFAKLKGYGLATKDRRCADQACLYLSPVFLIDMRENCIRKLN